MKAIVRDHYGPTSVLRLEDVPVPEPCDDEALIQIHKISVNDFELGLLLGNPFIVRLFGAGLFKTRGRIIGCDIAGTVHTVGSGVTKFSTGDVVFVDLTQCGFGGYAEYACAKEHEVTRKPASMSFEEAAALPQAAALAMQALIDKGGLRDGMKILFNGAGGGSCSGSGCRICHGAGPRLNEIVGFRGARGCGPRHSGRLVPGRQCIRETSTSWRRQDDRRSLAGAPRVAGDLPCPFTGLRGTISCRAEARALLARGRLRRRRQ